MLSTYIFYARISVYRSTTHARMRVLPRTNFLKGHLHPLTVHSLYRAHPLAQPATRFTWQPLGQAKIEHHRHPF